MDPRKEVDVPAPEGAAFRLQLHTFKFINRSSIKWPGRKLRFCLTWALDYAGLHLAQELIGCMAHKTKAGEIIWSPPMTTYGGRPQPTSYISRDLYDLVLKKVTESEFAKYLGEVFKDDAKAQAPEEVDAKLPATL